MHPLAPALVLNDAEIAQVTKVARDAGLGEIQRMDKLTDAQLLLHQQQKQATKARPIRQGTEELLSIKHMRIC